jgi:hypothetical protein
MTSPEAKKLDDIVKTGLTYPEDLVDLWPNDLLGRNRWTRGLVAAVQSGDFKLVDDAESLLAIKPKRPDYLSRRERRMATAVLTCARLVQSVMDSDQGPTESEVEMGRAAGGGFCIEPGARSPRGADCPEPCRDDRERVDACFQALLAANGETSCGSALTMAWDLCRTMIDEPRGTVDQGQRRL